MIDLIDIDLTIFDSVLTPLTMIDEYENALHIADVKRNIAFWIAATTESLPQYASAPAQYITGK
jgi:hypothetical protein